MGTRQESKRSRSLVRQEIADWRGKPIGTKIAHRTLRRLIDSVRGKDFISLRAVYDLAYHALVQITEAELRREKFKAKVMVDGRETTATIAARYGTRMRAKSGLKTKVVQYPLWIDEEWDVIEALRDTAVTDKREAAVREAVFGTLLELRDLYPEARSPRELMALANISFGALPAQLASGVAAHG